PQAIPKMAAQIGSNAYRIAARTGSSSRWNWFTRERATTVARTVERSTGTANSRARRRSQIARAPGAPGPRSVNASIARLRRPTTAKDVVDTAIGDTRFVIRSVARMWIAKTKAHATVASSPARSEISGRPRMNPATQVARTAPRKSATLAPRRSTRAERIAVKRT